MNKIKIKPYNVIDSSRLPEVIVNRELVSGDPIEIDKEPELISGR
jgi:hypothetical protein